MNNKSKKMLETLVRHKFYSSVDWAKCSKWKMEFLERELKAVIEACIDTLAPEFTTGERVEFVEDIIKEVRHYDCIAMLEYSRRLNPPIPVHQKVKQFLTNKLYDMTRSPVEIQPEHLRSTPEVG